MLNVIATFEFCLMGQIIVFEGFTTYLAWSSEREFWVYCLNRTWQVKRPLLAQPPASTHHIVTFVSYIMKYNAASKW